MQVCEDYAGVWYDNFAELEKDNPSLAKELLEAFDNGKWQKTQLFVYESLEDYAYYELTDGWYADKHLDQKDYNGAPNPIDFIDLKGCSTYGKTINEAYLMAQDAMGLYLSDLETFPTPTIPYNNIKLNENQFISIVEIDLLEYRKKYSNR